LELIKTSLGVGYVLTRSDGYVSYQVSSIKELQVLINHLDKYPLISQKLSDYLLFKQACELFVLNKHLTEEGLKILVGIKASLNKGLSDKLKEAFANTDVVKRPEVKLTRVKDDN
jgi:hypothetical protein